MPILYKKDLLAYPGTIIDLQSKNESWVRFAGKLAKMGVKNWGFCLALQRSFLQGVDPHSPDLDDFTRLAILEECEHNHWYFFREVLRIKTTNGDPGYLEANRGNIAAYWCVFNSFTMMLEQIRQTGKSLFGRTMACWFHHVGVENAQALLFTKGDLRSDEIKEYKLMRSMLPEWMYVKHPKDKDNQMEFTTVSRGNYTKTYIPQGDPVAANSVGRGTTPRMVQSDEGPFCPYAEISIPAMVGSTTRTFTDCARLGIFHSLFFTTTAGDLATKEGKYFFEKIRAKCMFFSEALYDCEDRNDALNLIFAASKNIGSPYVLVAFNHLQLGFSDEWLRQTIALNPANTEDQTKRDFLGIWTFGSATNPIGEKVLARIRKHIDYEPQEVRDGDYKIRYYGDPEWVKSRQVVMGLDCSEAIGRDSITGVGIDIETLETVVAFDINDTNLQNFAKWLGKFMVSHENITLVPENKNSWRAICDQLLIDLPLLGIDIGRRVYNLVVENARGSDRDERNYREFCHGQPSERKYHPYRTAFGFPTSDALRRILTGEVLKNATKENAEVIRDLNLIDELSSLVNKNGRVDHPAGGHDDHVISWLLAQWFVRSGRNLSHYGIDTRLIMSRMLKFTLETPKQQRMKSLEETKRIEIKRLQERLAQAAGLIEIRYLESKIASLESEISEEQGTSTEYASLDRASTEATDKRINKIRAKPKMTPINRFFRRF